MVKDKFSNTRVGVYVLGWRQLLPESSTWVWGDFDVSHQPIQAFGDHIPGRELFAYINAYNLAAVAAAWIVAASIARRHARTRCQGVAWRVFMSYISETAGSVHSSSVFNPKAGPNKPERAYGGTSYLKVPFSMARTRCCCVDEQS
jgi:hypothetical protein